MYLAIVPHFTALESLIVMENCIKFVDKSLAGTIMVELTTMKYNGSWGLKANILKMIDKVAKLKGLRMQVNSLSSCS